ncbi:MAG: DinB family protein [Pyrinomonadaceae bacterium]|nr:DinB family protein [Pyrinomonadaceae bacterium]
MENATHARPERDEYVPDYERYISLVPAEEDVLTTLDRQFEDTLETLRGIPEERGDFRYAEGKWSIKELVGHLADSERIFGYRALRFARNDQTPLPGFEQDDYVRGGRFGACRLSDLVDELENVRKANMSLFRHLDEEAWARRGDANGSMISVRAIVYIIAGHEAHHMRILRERYLS